MVILIQTVPAWTSLYCLMMIPGDVYYDIGDMDCYGDINDIMNMMENNMMNL